MSDFELKASLQIAKSRRFVEGVRDRLQDVSLWGDGAALVESCNKSLLLIDKVEERLQKKLVVSIVGGTGSGKSTLFNALVGSDNLSPIGITRPTTRKLIVNAKQRSDVTFLIDDHGVDNIDVRSSVNRQWDDVLLVDTPDTDSNEQDEYRDLLLKTIEQSDVLVCVFHAQNPKRKDNLEALRQCVDAYPGEHLVFVLSHCDRVPEAELKDVIVPDVKKHFSQAWSKSIESVFCVSGKTNLRHPEWNESAKPLHQFDQFSEFKKALIGSGNKPSAVVSTRLSRVDQICHLLRGLVRGELPSVQDVEGLKQEVARIDSHARNTAVDLAGKNGAVSNIGLTARVYKGLADAWVGPVGWLLICWSKMLQVGSLYKVGTPLAFGINLARMAINKEKTQNEIDRAVRAPIVRKFMSVYRSEIAKEWGCVAEKLIDVGFNSDLRRLDGLGVEQDDVENNIDNRWQDALDGAISDTVKKLSHTWTQLLFNAPTIILFLIASVYSVFSFYGNVFGKTAALSVEYFLNTIVAIATVLLISFFILQLRIRSVAGSHIFHMAVSRWKDTGREFSGEILSNVVDGDLRSVSI